MKKEKVTIRRGNTKEAAKVSATIIEFDEPYAENYFNERIKGKDSLIIISCINNVPAGYVIWYDKHGDGSFYCWMAGVNPEFRQRGLLKRMMDCGFEEARRRGYKRAKIKTRNARREMLSYLVKYGFQFTGVEQREDARENRIELEKAL